MNITCSLHRYAPELSVFYVNGVKFDTRKYLGMRTIPYMTERKQAVKWFRETFFKPIEKPFKYAHVTIETTIGEYSAKSDYQGRINSYSDITTLIKQRSGPDVPEKTIKTIIKTKLYG